MSHAEMQHTTDTDTEYVIHHVCVFTTCTWYIIMKYIMQYTIYYMHYENYMHYNLCRGMVIRLTDVRVRFGEDVVTPSRFV